MRRFLYAVPIALLILALTASDAFGHLVRVYNHSSTDVKVVVHHFTKPDDAYWAPPIVVSGGSSDLDDFTHGWRIVSVADAATGNVRATHHYYQTTANMQIVIQGTNPAGLTITMVPTFNAKP